MSKYHTDCYDTMKSIINIFPIEVDLPDNIQFLNKNNDEDEDEQDEDDDDELDSQHGEPISDSLIDISK
jgi:hypothetical protein